MAKTDFITHVGQRFTRWVVAGEAFRTNQRKVVPCLCDCGVARNVENSHLFKGTSKSCGCLALELVTTHGHKTRKYAVGGSAEYRAWRAMHQRTGDPNYKGYENYGGRGIAVCESWCDFKNFYADMGDRPSGSHSIERMNNEMGYSPENCKWATRDDQAKNKRNNRILTDGKRTMHLAEWARELGCEPGTIAGRIQRGWSEARAVTTPAQPWNR